MKSFNDMMVDALVSKEDVNFKPDEKEMIDKKLGEARFQHTKRMMKARRDGKWRVERQREKIQQSQDEQKPVAPPNLTKIDSLKNAPAKAKLKRTKKLLKKKADEKKKELANKTVFEVPGVDTEYEKVRLHLTDEIAPTTNKE